MNRSVSMSAAEYIYLHAKMADCLFPNDPLISLDLLDDIESDLRIDSGLVVRDNGEDDDTKAGADDSKSEGEVSNLSQTFTYDFAPVAQLMTLSSEGKHYRNLRGMPSVTFRQFRQSMLELADNWTTSCHPLEYQAFLWDLHSKIFADDWSAEADATINKSNRNKKGVKFLDAALDVVSVKKRRERVIGGLNSIVAKLQKEVMRGEDVQQVLSPEEMESLPIEVRHGLMEQQLQEAQRLAEFKAANGGAAPVQEAKVPGYMKSRGSSAGSVGSREERRSRQEQLEEHGMSREQLKKLAPSGKKHVNSKLLTLTTESTITTVLQAVAQQHPAKSQLPSVHYRTQ
jgi:hypothetical protein